MMMLNTLPEELKFGHAVPEKNKLRGTLLLSNIIFCFLHNYTTILCSFSDKENILIARSDFLYENNCFITHPRHREICTKIQ